MENLSNEINWLISKSASETLSDGTVSYYFKGNLPSRMVAAIRSQSKKSNGDTFSWSVKFGQYISSQNQVIFTFNDYSVPASNQ